MQENAESSFGRWYRSVDLTEDQESIAARWGGVKAVSEEIGDDEIEALVRLALNSRQPPPAEVEQAIRAKFSAIDPDFEQNNAREMQVLSGACLAAVMENGDYHAARAALSLTTASLSGARTMDLPMALVDQAEQVLASSGKSFRKRNIIASPKRATLNWKAVDDATASGLPEAAKAMGTAVQAALNVLSSENAKVIGKLEERIEVQDEELQMLWWLVGGYSQTIGNSFDRVPANAQPLLFGAELAEATAVLPGPISLMALLSRAGLKDDAMLTVPQAVNALDRELFRNFIPSLDDCSPVTQPIHFAIARQRETDEKEAWIAGWEAAAGIPKKHAIGSLTLGNLFYRERLLFLFADRDS